MYYLFLFSIVTTILVFLMKYEFRNKDGYMNCSEYMDPYGNLTIETHKYIYKMSRNNGRLFRKLKGSEYKKYKLIHSNNDDKSREIELNPITGTPFGGSINKPKIRKD